jgi:hypothetical protein
MQPFSCQHREQHISEQDYVSVVQDIRNSRLEPQRWSLKFVIFLLSIEVV